MGKTTEQSTEDVKGVCFEALCRAVRTFAVRLLTCRVLQACCINWAFGVLLPLEATITAENTAVHSEVL